MNITAVLLAAGKGVRMKSKLPKVLHPVAGKPMLAHALQAVSHVSTEKPVVVIGHQADQIKDYLGDEAAVKHAMGAVANQGKIKV